MIKLIIMIKIIIIANNYYNNNKIIAVIHQMIKNKIIQKSLINKLKFCKLKIKNNLK